MRLILLLLLTATIVAASNDAIDDDHLKPHYSPVVSSSRSETPLNLRGSAKTPKTEGIATKAATTEERVLSSLGKLKNVFKKNPNLAKTVATDPKVSDTVAKSSRSIPKKTVDRVRAFFTRNPSMTRGLDRYQKDQLIFFVVLLMSIGALVLSVRNNRK